MQYNHADKIESEFCYSRSNIEVEQTPELSAAPVF